MAARIKKSLGHCRCLTLKQLMITIEEIIELGPRILVVNSLFSAGLRRSQQFFDVQHGLQESALCPSFAS
jgi:hypothetical protein